MSRRIRLRIKKSSKSRVCHLRKICHLCAILCSPPSHESKSQNLELRIKVVAHKIDLTGACPFIFRKITRMPLTELFNQSTKPSFSSPPQPKLPPPSYHQVINFQIQTQNTIASSSKPPTPSMSPKKAASKPKWTQAEPVESADQDAWRPSKCIDFYLHGLVKEGVLQSHEKM